MESKDLEAKIAERKQQAKDRKIAERAYFIGVQLGSHFDFSRDPGDPDGFPETFGGKARYQNDALEIQCSYWGFSENTIPGSGYAMVTFEGKKVFEGRHEYSKDRIEAYIPGPWEELLDGLYPDACAANEQRELSARERAEREKERHLRTQAEPWGL